MPVHRPENRPLTDSRRSHPRVERGNGAPSGPAVWNTDLPPHTLLIGLGPSYTKSHLSEPMRPLAQSDGHDAPRLVDELVPGITAVVDEIVI